MPHVLAERVLDLVKLTLVTHSVVFSVILAAFFVLALALAVELAA